MYLCSICLLNYLPLSRLSLLTIQWDESAGPAGGHSTKHSYYFKPISSSFTVLRLRFCVLNRIIRLYDLGWLLTVAANHIPNKRSRQAHYFQERWVITLGPSHRIWTRILASVAPCPVQLDEGRIREDYSLIKRIILHVIIRLSAMVAGAGFEPAIFWLWAKRDDRLLYPAIEKGKEIMIYF